MLLIEEYETEGLALLLSPLSSELVGDITLTAAFDSSSSSSIVLQDGGSDPPANRSYNLYIKLLSLQFSSSSFEPSLLLLPIERQSHGDDVSAGGAVAAIVRYLR